MKTFTIEFRTDGEGFDSFPRDEVADVLRRIRDAVYSDHTSGIIKDGLGNEIGTWQAPDGWMEKTVKARGAA